MPRVRHVNHLLLTLQLPVATRKDTLLFTTGGYRGNIIKPNQYHLAWYPTQRLDRWQCKYTTLFGSSFLSGVWKWRRWGAGKRRESGKGSQSTEVSACWQWVIECSVLRHKLRKETIPFATYRKCFYKAIRRSKGLVFVYMHMRQSAKWRATHAARFRQHGTFGLYDTAQSGRSTSHLSCGLSPYSAAYAVRITAEPPRITANTNERPNEAADVTCRVHSRFCLSASLRWLWTLKRSRFLYDCTPQQLIFSASKYAYILMTWHLLFVITYAQEDFLFWEFLRKQSGFEKFLARPADGNRHPCHIVSLKVYSPT